MKILGNTTLRANTSLRRAMRWLYALMLSAAKQQLFWSALKANDLLQLRIGYPQCPLPKQCRTLCNSCERRSLGRK